MPHLRSAFAAALFLVIAAGVALAGESGTREEAKAMLEHAVKVLTADKDSALRLFTSGGGGFLDRDLYVFCAGPDGMMTAHPYVEDINLKEFKDKTGKAVGVEMYAVAEEGRFAEVSYKWVRPGGGDEQVDKVSFVTKVGDQLCGVGYYE
jgi:single cache domain-containing protein